jgi:hypothetical protein
VRKESEVSMTKSSKVLFGSTSTEKPEVGMYRELFFPSETTLSVVKVF